MMCELFGRATGTCKGKGRLLCTLPFLCRDAWGKRRGWRRHRYCRRVGLCRPPSKPANGQCLLFGDGGVNRGTFLEGLNWARVFDLPVLFVCEDNGFAAYTRSERMTAGPGAVARAESLGVPGLAVDGNDAFAVYDAAAQLIGDCRAGRGPRFLYAKTYRLDGHTISDKTPYRSQEEVESHREQDPLRRLARQLTSWGLREADIDKVYEQARSEMARAVQVAHDAPWPEESDALMDVQILGAPQ